MFRISQNAQNILGDWGSSRSSPAVDSDSESGEGLWARANEQFTMKEEGEEEGDRISRKWRQSGRATFIVQELPLAPSPVSRPRVALMGNLTLISDVWSTSTSTGMTPSSSDPGVLSRAGDDEIDELEKCYLAHHPDAKWWIPKKGSFHVSIVTCPLRLLSCPTGLCLCLLLSNVIPPFFFKDVSWARFDPQAVYYVGGFGG
jgi:hypothetical protein